MVIQTESLLSTEIDGSRLDERHHNQQTRDIRKIAKELNKSEPTSRPVNPSYGEFYFDKILNKPIWFNGSNWCDSEGAVR